MAGRGAQLQGLFRIYRLTDSSIQGLPDHGQERLEPVYGLLQDPYPGRRSVSLLPDVQLDLTLLRSVGP